MIGAILLSPAAISACSSQSDPATTGSADDSQPTGTSPITTAGTDEWLLIARYEAALAAHPDLAPMIGSFLEQHRAHASALGVDAPASTPSVGPSPKDRTRALALLAAAESAARAQRIDACVASESAEDAALLALIAASEASHAVALDGLANG